MTSYLAILGFALLPSSAALFLATALAFARFVLLPFFGFSSEGFPLRAA